MARSKLKIEKSNTGRWFLTYTDLLNLLLVFFIILYALSKVDQSKLDELSNAIHSVIRKSLGNKFIDSKGKSDTINIKNHKKISKDKLGISGNNADNRAGDAKTVEDKLMEQVKEKVASLVQKEGLESSVSVTIDVRGVVVSLATQMFFKPGSSEITPKSKPAIKDIGKLLKKLNGNFFRVEGHTSPENSQISMYPSNWELSSMRANKILRLLVNEAGINPNNISAVGYAGYRPLVPNTSTENVAKNRRVDIVIVKSTLNNAEPDKLN